MNSTAYEDQFLLDPGPCIELNTWCNRDCTIGRLFYEDFYCLTLELPWLGNQRNISCIPEGRYRAEFYNSPKHNLVILLEDVPNRSMIEIHAGNYTRQIQGCILVGDSLKYMDEDAILDVTNSRNTLSKLLSVLPENFSINIVRTT